MRPEMPMRLTRDLNQMDGYSLRWISSDSGTLSEALTPPEEG